MRIVCYFINYNDSFYLPFFHKHYSQFCERIVMFDQYSTDGSREIATALGIEVRLFGGSKINDQDYLNIKNDKLGGSPVSWKECRGKGIDYVIIVDIDEFVKIPPNIMGTFPFVAGYNMISASLPEKDIFEINKGEYSDGYSKRAIFNPDAIEEINYVHGCHKCDPVGILTSDINSQCYLYHYRMIGGVDRIIERHKMYMARMSSFNLQHKMGFHYAHSDNAKRDEWNFLMSNAKELW